MYGGTEFNHARGPRPRRGDSQDQPEHKVLDQTRYAAESTWSLFVRKCIGVILDQITKVDNDLLASSESTAHGAGFVAVLENFEGAS
jgi:hypothetical protein